MKKIKTIRRCLFAPQTKPTEGTKTLLFATVIYLLLLIWAIVFKFSVISVIHINPHMTLADRFFNGFHFFDFLVESNRWLQIRGCLVTVLNVLLFMPWGIYASFFWDKKRTVFSAFAFSAVIECTQLFANFGVFSLEDIILNTLGAFFGVLIFQKNIDGIHENTTHAINRWTVRIGAPFAAVAYGNVIVAMILYFS